MRVLFLCSKNRWRSPTAEQVFSEYPGVECSSAGVSHDAGNPVSAELLDWAEIIFVMERVHQTKLTARFSPHLRNKRIICLHIPDKYQFMDPLLVKLLKSKVDRYLKRSSHL